MPFSMQTFMQHVRTQNTHFERVKASSLAPLITALGGAYGGRGPDNRVISNAIRRRALVVVEAMPQAKVQKYQTALAYAETQLGVEWLKLETKTGWAAATTPTTAPITTPPTEPRTELIHCTSATPQQVGHSGGLSPRFSREWVMPDDESPWNWHKFIFSFCPRTDDPYRPSPAVIQLGFARPGGFVYFFTVPGGTHYMSQGGRITAGTEIAVAENVALDRIEGAAGWDGRRATRVEDWP